MVRGNRRAASRTANRPRLAFLGLADAATATDHIEHRAVTRHILDALNSTWKGPRWTTQRGHKGRSPDRGHRACRPDSPTPSRHRVR